MNGSQPKKNSGLLARAALAALAAPTVLFALVACSGSKERASSESGGTGARKAEVAPSASPNPLTPSASPSPTPPPALLLDSTYDPTNGSTAIGDVYRLKQ